MIAGPPGRDNPGAEQATIAVALGAHRDLFQRAGKGAEEVSVTNLARRVAESHGFQNFILGVILVTAVIVGLETSETLVERYGGLFELEDLVVQTAPSPPEGRGWDGYRRGVRPSRSSSGMRPLMRSATIRAVPHAIVQPMCPWPQLKKRLR